MLNGERGVVVVLCRYPELERGVLEFWNRRGCEVVLVRDNSSRAPDRFDWQHHARRAMSVVIVERDEGDLTYWRGFVSARPDLRRLPLNYQQVTPFGGSGR